MAAFTKALVGTGVVLGTLGIVRAVRRDEAKAKKKTTKRKGRTKAAVADAFENGAELIPGVAEDLYKGKEWGELPAAWASESVAYSMDWEEAPTVRAHVVSLSPESQALAYEYMLNLVGNHGYDLSDETSLKEATVRTLSKAVAPKGDWYTYAYDRGSWTPPAELDAVWNGVRDLGLLAYANLWTKLWVDEAVSAQGEAMDSLEPAMANYYALDQGSLNQPDSEALNDAAFCGTYLASALSYPDGALPASEYTVPVRLTNMIQHLEDYLGKVVAGASAMDPGAARDEILFESESALERLKAYRGLLLTAALLDAGATPPASAPSPPVGMETPCHSLWIMVAVYLPLFVGAYGDAPVQAGSNEGVPDLYTPYLLGDKLLAASAGA